MNTDEALEAARLEAAAAGRAAAEEEAIEGRMAVGLEAAGPELPREIMVMPGGVHTIQATRGEKDVEATVLVDERTAQALEAALREHRQGPVRPWFDFDHALKGPASAWPAGFAWRAAPKPGVYAQVEWSKAGAEAVQGKMYRGFSPRFFVDKSDPARVTGAPLNMGGLVNDPAFREMAPLFARAGKEGGYTEGEEERKETLLQKETKETKGTKENTIMTEQELAALQARVIALEKENEGLKASQNTAALEARHNTAVAAKDSEIAGLKRENETLKESLQARAKKDADEAIQAAVARGAIAPRDTALQARWRALVEADAGNLELLNGLAGNPALRPVTAAQGRGAGGAILASAAGEHEFVTVCRALAVDEKITFAAATARVAGEQPALYAGYAASIAGRQ